jgi:hypothetical protein
MTSRAEPDAIVADLRNFVAAVMRRVVPVSPKSLSLFSTLFQYTRFREMPRGMLPLSTNR